LAVFPALFLFSPFSPLLSQITDEVRVYVIGIEIDRKANIIAKGINFMFSDVNFRLERRKKVKQTYQLDSRE
jgi:hypothetical protein